MGRAAGRSTAGDLALALPVALIVLALGVVGAGWNHSLAESRRATADEHVLGHAAAAVAEGFEARIGAAASVASAASAGATAAAGFVSVAGGPAPERLGASAPSAPVVAAALDRARDSAEPVVTAPVDLGEGPRLLVVAAAYSPVAGGGPPPTTVARRQRLIGWAVDVVDPTELLAPVVGHDLVGSISDGATTWRSGAGRDPARLRSQVVDVHGRQLVIRAGDPAAVGTPGSFVAALAVTSLLAVAGGAAVVATRRLVRRREAQLANRTAQVQLIAEVAPLVQQSLELADILPAIAVLLSDHFGLAGVSLATPSASSGHVELFSMGAPPSSDGRVLLHPPARLAAGETLSLALERAGRSVALLHLVAGRDLDEVELGSLRAVTEFVTAAVVNAALYASQQATVRRLRELDTLKTVFLGTASHELRTPATAITGFAGLLSANWEQFDETQRRDFVARIDANARSLTAVLQDLLDFSLLDKGTLAVSIVELDLGELVGSVVDRLGSVFPNHEIAFTAAPAPPVAGDVNGLERIVTNLLTNATKFSPHGTTVTVAVGPGHGGYAAELVVSDQGPGIPPDERGHVFSRFYRGSGDAVTRTRGAGIGLSVVAEFVARLRGEVDVDEAPGGGARFTVRLPASTTLLMAKEAANAPTT